MICSTIFCANMRAGTRLRLELMGDDGLPVEGLKLSIRGEAAPKGPILIWGGEQLQREVVEVTTDKAGVGVGAFGIDVWSLENEDAPGELGVATMFDSPKYYWSWLKYKGQPPVTPGAPKVFLAKATLRRKLAPHAMNEGFCHAETRPARYADMARDFAAPTLPREFFTEGKPVAYDMVMGAFMPPVGTGRHADMSVSVDLKGPANMSRAKLAGYLVDRNRDLPPGDVPPDITLKYRFRFSPECGVVPIPLVNQPDWLDAVNLTRVLGGKIPQEAPASGYVSEVEKSVTVSAHVFPKQMVRHPEVGGWIYRLSQVMDENHFVVGRERMAYFFRIRQEKDNGKQSVYGVFKGEFGCHGDGFMANYCINTTAGLRNVEQIQMEGGSSDLAPPNLKLFLDVHLDANRSEHVVESLRPLCAEERKSDSHWVRSEDGVFESFSP